MTEEELLIKIREDRPDQKIYDVLTFKEISPGIYDAQVDMEYQLFGVKMRGILGIVYPRFKFDNVLNLPHYD